MSKHKISSLLTLALGSLLALSAMTLLVLYLSAGFGYVPLVLAEALFVSSIVLYAIGIRQYLTRMLASSTRHTDVAVKQLDNRLSELTTLLSRDNEKIASLFKTLEERATGTERAIRRHGELSQTILSRLEAAERRLVESVESSTFNTLDVTDSIVRNRMDQVDKGVHESIVQTNQSIDVLAERIASWSKDDRKAVRESGLRLGELSRLITEHRNTIDAKMVTVRNDATAAFNGISKVADCVDQLLIGVGEIKDAVCVAVDRSENIEAKTETAISALFRETEATRNIEKIVGELRGESKATTSELKDCNLLLETQSSFHNQLAESLDRRVAEIEAGVRLELNRIADSLNEAGAANRTARTHIVDLLNELSSRVEHAVSDIEGSKPVFGRSWEELRRTVFNLNDTLSNRDSKSSDQLVQILRELDALNGVMSQIHSSQIESYEKFGQPLVSEIEVIRDSVKTVERLTDTSKTDTKALFRHVQRSGTDTVRQVEALLQLMERVDSPALRFPPSGGFAMNPDSLLLLSDIILNHKPKRILELGSGSSTVWTGYFAKSVGAHCVSIEHLEEYYSKTMQQLLEFGLDSTVELLFAPLEEVSIDGALHEWYRSSIFEDFNNIDLLIVDGPPESTGPNARFPAFPVLRDHLSENALILIDDIDRAQETDMVDSWVSDTQGLELTELQAGRTGVLRYRRK